MIILNRAKISNPILNPPPVSPLPLGERDGVRGETFRCNETQCVSIKIYRLMDELKIYEDLSSFPNSTTKQFGTAPPFELVIIGAHFSQPTIFSLNFQYRTPYFLVFYGVPEQADKKILTIDERQISINL
jgi:hypothetical protein